ncbi:hypothetical protein BO99DRAFT_443151 [Aspergillus violaceofuscus CBS 115571]|uniref:Uncharacterized protein n=1 Tax=Aspergillus violaceofuscus (strain CBS 115571) TaxID=1450538 RepID=A0A2V5H5C9_ASPV1|nr:hypothetical protein BO99DRAFT_443151 [Aspergillus violaceofuscus CBS 115571]
MPPGIYGDNSVRPSSNFLLPYKTATGMLGDAKDFAAVLRWAAAFWDADLEEVWDPYLRKPFGNFVCALAARFFDAEKAHRMEHHVAATTKLNTGLPFRLHYGRCTTLPW